MFLGFWALSGGVPVKDVGYTAMLQPMSHFTALQDQSDNHFICSTEAAYIWRWGFAPPRS